MRVYYESGGTWDRVLPMGTKNRAKTTFQTELTEAKDSKERKEMKKGCKRRKTVSKSLGFGTISTLCPQ